jgi:hypothetical protein
MWRPLQTSGFALTTTAAGTGRTREPVLVDQIDLA